VAHYPVRPFRTHRARGCSAASFGAFNLVINQVILYLLLALGGVGVALALPRRGLSPQIIGGLLAGAAGGLVILLLSAKASEHLPNLYFYIFSVIALGAGLRVITHPRPVYAALYFILTVIASAGLFVILSAEFLAFALIIVYAGAILITYLFVIMLATQAPTFEDEDVLADYDAVAREPVLATVVGFLLLAVLTTLMFRGAPQLPAPASPTFGDANLVALPGRIETGLKSATPPLMQPGEFIVRDEVQGGPRIVLSGENPGVYVASSNGDTRFIPRREWPADLEPSNIEGVAFELLAGHPGAIEMAGVILLMAMLGAVVLARKQVQLDEEAKAGQVQSLAAEVRRSEVLP
jgi:NADH-quinone oxidoreductase subunit J